MQTNFIGRVKGWFHRGGASQPLVISRRQHKISRQHISPNALKVLYRLNKAGYAAYLVGGGVRDLLLKHRPKDFDIATDAHPEDIRGLFRNSRIIGRRFRLVHVHYYDEIIEVCTFRSSKQQIIDEVEDKSLDGDAPPVMVKYDNSYGTIEEDAWRRDFTVNALYYNIEDFSVVDFTAGMADIKKRQIRMIGDPVERYHEDPVRLLRAIRLASKLNFKIEKETESPLIELAPLLEHVSPARLYEEVLKLFFKGHAVVTFNRLEKYHYMRVLFPATYTAIAADKTIYRSFIKAAMQATDVRYEQGQSINPGFLMAVLLWPAVQARLQYEQGRHEHFYQEVHAAIEYTLREQTKTLMIPKRLKMMMRSVWLLQYHLLNRRTKRVYRALSHRYFRAAYDFLELRVKAGEEYADEYQWWKRFQAVKPAEREQMLAKLVKRTGKSKKPRKPKKANKRDT